MIELDFKSLENIDHIARAVNCLPSFIHQVLERTSLFYNIKKIPKKGKRQKGQYRIIYEVELELNIIQKNISTAITSKQQFHEYVQGFVSKRSIATNASLHLSKKYVLNLDIKNFFDSITQKQVSDVFKELGCTERSAEIFTKLCTLNGHLVQGASTSPVLANLVCKELDQDFARLAQQYNCSYSRYADDITFSGDLTPGKKDIEKCLNKYEFELNPAKWKHQRRGRSQYVTGLTVFDNTKPRIPKFIKKQLRQILYYASKYGWDNHESKVNSCNHKNMHYEIKRINGLIAFMYSVEPERALQFDLQWQKIIKEGLLDENQRDPHAIFARHSRV
ncbi:MAG: reverse transcriptase family protein [Nostoc sp.]|uniref:reverse transcriptase family protein n=1 Tax=Nostoc sp. TaxID=1180 RepID=UPI002FFB08F7